MDLIEWDEKYAVRLDELDGEHKRLFALINELNRAVVEGSAPEKCGETLKSLLEYTEYHFSHEEAVLKKREYSQLDQHVIAHNILIGRVRDLREKLADGDEITGEMMNFLQDWICQHILTLDRHYAEELTDYSLAE